MKNSIWLTIPLAASFLAQSVFSQMWVDYPWSSPEGDVDTGDFLGWVNVQSAPYLWHYEAGDYLYMPEEYVSETGAWGFLLDLVDTGVLPWRTEFYPVDWVPPEEADFYTDAFVQDFSYAGYHSGEKSLPEEIPGTVVDVTAEPYNADPSGTVDATEAIQSAIDFVGVAGGGVVYLPEGTYRLSPGSFGHCLQISRDNTVLQGAGPEKTFLFNSEPDMRRNPIIRVAPRSGGTWSSGADEILITEDLMSPTHVLPVDTTDGYAVGDWVIVRTSMTDAWALEHKEPEWTGASANSSLRGLAFCRQVMAIDSASKTITVDVPLRYAVKVRDEARIYKVSNMLTEVGIEGLAIANQESTNASGWYDNDGTLNNQAHNVEGSGAYTSQDSWLIILDNALNSWIRNVRSYHPASNPAGSHMLSNGILVEECRGITLENIHLKNAQYGGGGGNGYGFRLQANETLVKECSAELFRHGFVVSFMRSSGNVVHRCHDADTGYVTATNGRARTGSSGSDFHMWFSPSCLVDQMDMDNSYYSILHRKGVGTLSHGTVSAHTVVWNLTANNTRYNRAIAMSQSRYGYVFGTDGSTPNVLYQVPDSIAFRYDVGGVRTAPEDIVEGIGRGELLRPQSLYLDQLQKRLGQSPDTASREGEL